jgi:hypothetical protein
VTPKACGDCSRIGPRSFSGAQRLTWRFYRFNAARSRQPGATPARDSAVVGFQATTTIAAATQLYLRYDGGVDGGTDNHALMAGLRMSW